MKTKNNNLQLKTKNWYRYFIFTIKLFFLLILLLLILVLLLKLFNFMLNNNRINPFSFLGLGTVYAANGNDNDNDDKSKDKGKNSEGIFSKIWKGIRWILSPILSFGKENKEKIKKTNTDTDTDPNFNFNPYLNPDEYFEEKKKKNIFSKTWGWIKSWFIKPSTSSSSEVSEEKMTQYKKDDEIIQQKLRKHFEHKSDIEDKLEFYLTDDVTNDIEKLEILKSSVYQIIEVYKKLGINRDDADDLDKFMFVKNFEEEDRIVNAALDFVNTCRGYKYSYFLIEQKLKHIFASMIVSPKGINLEDFITYTRLHIIYRVKLGIDTGNQNFYINDFTDKGHEFYQNKIKNLTQEKITTLNKRYLLLMSYYKEDLLYMNKQLAKARLLARHDWFERMNNYSDRDLSPSEQNLYYDYIKKNEYDVWFNQKIEKYNLNQEEINQCKRMFIDNIKQGKSIKRSFSQNELDEITDSEKIEEYSKLFQY